MEQYWNITIVQVSIPVLPHKMIRLKRNYSQWVALSGYTLW